MHTNLATTADTDEEKVTLDLTEDTIDTQDMIQNVVEEHERNIEFFLVEDT